MRSTTRESAYEIRYKQGDAFRSAFVPAKDPRQAAARADVKGRILSINKVSNEKLFKIGDDYLRKMLLPDPKLFGVNQLFSKISADRKDAAKIN